MMNIAALGLYMVLTGISGNPTAVTPPQTVESPILVENTKKESENETDKDVEAHVRDYFSDIPIMIEVVRCESEFRQFANNGDVLRGKAVAADVGVAQINEKYHLKRSKSLGIDIYTLDGNLAYARELYEDQGTGPWMASAPCWGHRNLTIKNLSTPLSNS